MFELSVARKYLIPRVRQLSVSIISVISLFVIATVVWLSIVFFSAQEGIERSWTEKMVALTSPLRLTPTPAYYKSYYYQIDSYSMRSGYASKTLREKLLSPTNAPYDPAVDPSLPSDFPKKSSQDIVKETLNCIKSIPGTTSSIFESASVTLQIRLIHDQEQRIKTGAYLMSYDPSNARLAANIIEPKVKNPLVLSDNGILLPKGFKDIGVQVGDTGFISYSGFGATSLQENHAKIVVQGFYDPGILPIGGKVVLAKPQLVEQIQQASFSQELALPTGFAVDFADIKKAHEIKERLLKLLTEHDLAKYWKVETYDEYDFTKDIFQQMRSDKNLFMLISVIITIVACSNIISMLIILVHDKKKEIAIMRALGATKRSIAFIFGLSGFLLGFVGSIVGAILAILTLHNLSSILGFISKLQGFEVLNSTFYANSLPNEVSLSALAFVVTIAGLASCLAGLIPAWQASRINTSEALRNE